MNLKPGKRFGNAMVLALSLALSVLFFEGAVRLFMPVYDPSGQIRYTHNKDGVRISTPNFNGRQWKNTGDYDVRVRTNRFGLRDAKDFQASTTGDLFVAGDSYSFGMGVEEHERYSNLLEKILKKNVYNLAVPGTNLLDYYETIEYAKKNKAAVHELIVSVCMENDLLNYRSDPKIRTPASAKGSPLDRLKVYLSGSSAIYNLATTFAHRSPRCARWMKRWGLIKEFEESPRQAKISSHTLSEVSEVLEMITAGQKTLVLLIPSRWLWVGSETSKHTERRIHEELVAMLHARGLEVLDLRIAFEETGDPVELYFKKDPHWNREGHQKAAEAIAKKYTG